MTDKSDEIEGLDEIEAEERSKKDQILELAQSGVTDIAAIVRRVRVRPSYVAQVLQQAGHLGDDYFFALFTGDGTGGTVYARFFRNVLRFDSVDEARASVERINRLYNYFERLGDRAGQHQACICALTGKNRARWSGKPEAAEIFSEWLAAH